MKPLLVGECPSLPGVIHRPLGGMIARRLCELAVIPPTADSDDRFTLALYERFECVNLYDRAEDAQGRSKADDRKQWGRLRRERLNPVVILLGRRVADAAGLEGSLWFVWRSDDVGLLVPCPHPSGLNRAYNDLAVRRQVGALLQEAAGL